MLNEKYASIKIERDQWEADKQAIKDLLKYDSEVVSLNVGGTHHI
jgi:transcriptional/translational regulatory protein YebC/TACO1